MAFFRRSKNRKLIFIFVLLLVIGVGGLFFFKNLKKVSAEWYDSNWYYRQAVTITVTSSGSDVSNLDTWFSMNTSALITANKLQSSCQDLRFTNASGKLLPYYIDSGCNTTTTKIWVKADLVPKNSTTYTLYAYYGNPSASSGQVPSKFNLYNGLIGYWNMNEASWTNDCSTATVKDLSVSGNNSKSCPNTTGPTGAAAGKYGNGGSFDGSDDNVIENPINNFPSSEITAGFWMKSSDGTKTGTPISYASTASDNDFLIYNYGNFTIYRAGNNVPTGIAANDGNWHHIVVTWKGSNGDSKLYKDGNLAWSGTVSSGTTITNGGSLVFGQEQDTVGGGFDPTQAFLGSLDDVRIYNRVLTAAEVSQLYSDGTSSILTAVQGQSVPTVSFATEEKGPGPVVYWKFDEGQGSTANNSARSSNNGTLSNYSSANPTWAAENQCIFGKCLSFNGTSTTGGYVSSSTNADISNITELTVSAWVNIKQLHADYQAISSDQWTKYYLGFSPNSRSLWFNVRQPDTNQVGSGSYTLPNTDQWYFVTGVASESNGVSLYVNGIRVSNNPTPFTIVKSSGNIIVGADGTGSAADYFNGFIDDLKIYPYARTAAQIKTDYSSRGSLSGVSAKVGNDLSPLSNGLVGFWKMDEGTGAGSFLADSSGAGNAGTAVLWGGGNTATDSAHVAGKFGNAFSFDGGDDYVSIPNSANLGYAAPTISYSAWVKMNVLPSVDAAIVSRAGDGFAMYVQAAGTIFAEVYINSAVEFYTISNTAISLNTWNHITATFDGDSLKIYINGVLDKTRSGAGATTFYNYANSWNVGRSTALRYYLSGSVDELRIYNRALSPKEISDLYSFASGPWAYYKLDEGSGTTSVIDSSGNGNTATMNGAAASDWTTGKYGKALSFSGSKYLNISVDSWIRKAQDVTISGWYYHSADTDGAPWGITTTTASPDYDGFWWHLKHSNGPFYLRTEDNTHGESDGSGTPFVTPGNWYYLTTIVGTNRFDVYVNGSLYWSWTPNNSFSWSLINSDPAYFYIGRAYSTHASVNGKIDDVKIYNYARTQKQIAEDMNAGHPSVGSPVGSYSGWWKFDEGHDTTAYDQSVNANTGTITGATWTNDSKFGKALVFNGTNSSINAGNNASLQLSTGVSVSAWIKTGTIAQYAVIAGKIKSGIAYTLEGDTANNIMFAVNSRTNKAVSNKALNDNVWHHLVGTYDGSTVKLYVDGILQTVTAALSANITNVSDKVGIGSQVGSDNSTNQYFTGIIDEVKIYPFALTAADIQAEYNQRAALAMGSLSDTSGLTGGSIASNSASAIYCIPGDTANCNPPIGEWKFEEYVSGNSKTMYDTSGNGNNGTTNWGANAAGMNCKVVGKFGSACQFDGVDDYVIMTPAVGTGTKTLEVWFKPVNAQASGRHDIVETVGDNFGVYLNNGVLTGYVWYSFGGSVRKYVYYNTPTNQWTHVALIADNANYTLTMYVNGVAGTPTATDAGVTLVTNGDGNVWQLGQYYYSGANHEPFNGLIDNVQIYNYVRTPAQVAWDYSRGKPVGWWKFDECQGATAYDSTGNGNTGTITIGATGSQATAGTCTTPSDGTGAWYNGKTGKFNSAVSLDGTDDYVQTPYSNNWDDVKSISAWIKISDITHNSYPVFGSFYSASDYGLLLHRADKNGLTFQSQKGSFIKTTPSQNLVANTWTHIVLVKNGTNVKIYQNAVKITDETVSNTGFSASNLQIGSDGNGVSNMFNGLIDDVKIYNYALTPLQVRLDYNQGSTVRFGPLQGRP